VKVLLSSWKGEGGWFVWLFKHKGHQVDWVVQYDEAANSMHGLIPPARKKVNPKAYDLVVFDCTKQGEDAEHALSLGVPAIGDSALSDRLENDRLFGIEAMELCGIKVPPYECFDSPEKAIAWLQKTHKRCVLKPLHDAPSEMTYVGKNEQDMIQFIEKRLPGSKVKEFLLQEFVAGTEVSSEAWWTGTEWCAMNYTLEEKKFMAGGVGPNTGCAGNVVWMPTRITPIFQQGLQKASPLLADAGYRGMLDLNTIVTEGEVYGLEWTPRFGYEGTCNLTRLLPLDFAEFLHSIATGVTPSNLTPRAKFASTLRLSVPPYPNHDVPAKMRAHQPIKGLSSEDLETFFTFDVELEEGELVATGEGNIGTPIGTSETIQGAFDEVLAKIKALDIPDLQYRVDVPKCVENRYLTLERQGWLRPLG
jgi:phosphoribosylamine-glycine ligase